MRTCRRPRASCTNASTKCRRPQRAFAAAARLGKQDPDIQNSYAGFLCRTGKAAAGEKLFLEVARNPIYQTPEVALLNAGVCVRRAGDVVDAERYFNRALAIRPNMPEALLEIGNLALERGDAAEALEFVKRYLAVNPPTPEILWLGYRAERKLGDSTARGRLCPALADRVPEFRTGTDAALRHRPMSEVAQTLRTAAEGGARAARHEHAKGRRRNASRCLGHRSARDRRLSAHRSAGVRQGSFEEIREHAWDCPPPRSHPGTTTSPPPAAAAELQPSNVRMRFSAQESRRPTVAAESTAVAADRRGGRRHHLVAAVAPAIEPLSAAAPSRPAGRRSRRRARESPGAQDSAAAPGRRSGRAPGTAATSPCHSVCAAARSARGFAAIRRLRPHEADSLPGAGPARIAPELFGGFMGRCARFGGPAGYSPATAAPTA